MLVPYLRSFCTPLALHGIFWGGVASQGEVTSRGRCLFECCSGFLDESLVNKGERFQLLCISCQQGGFFQGGALLNWFSYAFVRDLQFFRIDLSFLLLFLAGALSLLPLSWGTGWFALHDCVERYLFLEESCFSLIGCVELFPLS